jgi:hypothetical protein
VVCINICFFLSHGKAKEKKKGPSLRNWQVALGEENIKRKSEGAFPECPGIWHSGKDILKKGRGLPRVPEHLALGEGYFF